MWGDTTTNVTLGKIGMNKKALYVNKLGLTYFALLADQVYGVRFEKSNVRAAQRVMQVRYNIL